MKANETERPSQFTDKNVLAPNTPEKSQKDFRFCDSSLNLRYDLSACFMSQPFKDHFSDVAGRYADFRPHYPASLFDYLATIVPDNSSAWDCAAGSGQATLDLAARFER